MMKAIEDDIAMSNAVNNNNRNFMFRGRGGPFFRGRSSPIIRDFRGSTMMDRPKQKYSDFYKVRVCFILNFIFTAYPFT